MESRDIWPERVPVIRVDDKEGQQLVQNILDRKANSESIITE